MFSSERSSLLEDGSEGCFTVPFGFSGMVLSDLWSLLCKLYFFVLEILVGT